MKSSINFLPAEKRRDLHQLVEIIRNEIKDCVMIILYGSYARDMYVDCDRRRDYGVTTFFMSDYDILIVTRRRLGLKEYDVYARITERFFENKQSEFYTRPQFINESISRLNKSSNWDNTSTMKSKSRESCSTPRRSSNWRDAEN